MIVLRVILAMTTVARLTEKTVKMVMPGDDGDPGTEDDEGGCDCEEEGHPMHRS